MSVVIVSSAMRTALGDADATFQALCEGRSGAADLDGFDRDRTGVLRGYHVPDEPGLPRTPSRWLTDCVRTAVTEAGADLSDLRVSAVVGTGLRELRQIERWRLDEDRLDVGRLHFGPAVRTAVPGAREVTTLSNACSAGGHALAIAQDLLELGRADAVVVGAADAMTASMLAMIGRLGDPPVDQLRPFDRARGGALLGEGAAAMVLLREEDVTGAPIARLLATGLSCDAVHETGADFEGIQHALRDAFDRAGRTPAEVGLVVAHGTGTSVNDRLECRLLSETYDELAVVPHVTALKGALGHTSGAAALMGVDVAARCLRAQVIPPVSGLRHRIPEAEGLPLVRQGPTPAHIRLAQVNAFGFGGVNAITLLAAPA